LLWDMPDNEGYIKIVAVMQKFFDQAISGNWSYNPTHFENNEVPMSVMFKDLLTTYKLGWKTSYYQNTYDYKTDASVEVEDNPVQDAAKEFEHLDGSEHDPLESNVEVSPENLDASCDACEI